MNSSEYLEVCTVHYTANSGYLEILELKPVQKFHQAGCVCGPANWMPQIFDI